MKYTIDGLRWNTLNGNNYSKIERIIEINSYHIFSQKEITNVLMPSALITMVS